MPSLRGIDVSVVLDPNDEPLPELPHPDASSISLCSPPSARLTSSPSSNTLSTPAKSKATTSVYIPSYPGAQFHIRYNIQTPPLPSSTRYVYFRMLINGHPTVSWGVRSLVGVQMVSYALYEPDDKWAFRDNGITYKRDGVERRYFRFSPNAAQSAVMDGGLIEIQVFRSQLRKRTSSELASFRSQVSYGIASSTGGLIDSPQDLNYYDWLLIDPKESPFISFRFFYRTWTTLKELCLVSDSCYDQLLAAAQGNIPPQEMKAPDLLATTGDVRGPFNFGPVDGSVFEGGGESERRGKGKQVFRLPVPPKLAPPSENRSNITQPSKSSRAVRQVSDSLRPLPTLPDAEANLRRPSTDSIRAPSVTPSLLPYIDEASGVDEVELGVARKVVIPENTLVRPLPMAPSSSDYEKTPPSTGGLEVYKRVGRYQHATRDDEDERCGSRISKVKSASEKFGGLTLSESEWLKGSPQRPASPLRRKQGRRNLNSRTSEATNEASGDEPELPIEW